MGYQRNPVTQTLIEASEQVLAPAPEVVRPAGKARVAGRGGATAKAANAGADAHGNNAGVDVCSAAPSSANAMA